LNQNLPDSGIPTSIQAKDSLLYETEHLRLSAALSRQRGDSPSEARRHLESAIAAAN